MGVTIVHILFGLSVFAMGYGRYFYAGTDAVARIADAAPVLAQ